MLEKATLVHGGRMSQAEGVANAQPLKEEEAEASVMTMGINDRRAKR